MVTEIELKYSVLENRNFPPCDIKSLVSDLFAKNGLVVEHQQKFLTNAYYDTQDLALRKSKIALRTRGTKQLDQPIQFEQTIKTSGAVIAGLHQRPEYNIDIASPTPELSLFPKDIWHEHNDIEQLQQDIIELFSTNFTRHTWLITLDNAQVEVAFDNGEIVCAGGSEKLSIFEIELELVSGDAKALFDLTKLLFSKLNLRPGQLTKAARGYALHKSVGSFKSAINELEPQQSQTSTLGNDDTSDEISKVNTPLPKCLAVDGSYAKSLQNTLKKLQLAVDGYVLATSNQDRDIRPVCHYLTLIRQIICHFEGVVTPEELQLSKDLAEIIKTLDDINKNVQGEANADYQTLVILHGERFNNIQLSLLASILKEHNE